MRSGGLRLIVALAAALPALAQNGSPYRWITEIEQSKTLDRNLRVLCDEIGARMTGTPNLHRAVDWGVSAFRAAGLTEVRTESFTVPSSWTEESATAEVTAPERFPVRLAGAAWGPGTPTGGLEAEVVGGGRGDEGELTRLGPAVRGKIVLISSQAVTSFSDLAVEYRRALVATREAEGGGAAAVLLMSTQPRGALYRHITSLDGRVAGLPSAVVSREDALRMSRLLATGQRLRLRLTLRNKVRGPVEARNVIAEIRGREKPDEVVLYGAHLDSWDLGTGCLDNAVNAALAVEVARFFQVAERPPRRTVRFVLFSGEEQGLLGSRSYVARHRDELDSHVAVVVHDIGDGRITGYSLGGRRDMEEPVRESLAPVSYRGATSHTTDAFFGSDHFDFLLEGIPTLVANQDTTDYVPHYHAASDTLDKVDFDELRADTAIAATLLWGLADRSERPARRLTRAEIEQQMRETRLEEQLKFLGLWEQWAQGRRGRAR